MKPLSIDLLQYFLRRKGHGNGLIIKGGVGTGKTTMLSFLIKLLLDYTNFVILTNVRFENEVYEKYPMRIFFVSGLKEYLTYYSEIPYSQPLLLMWDDSQGNTAFTSKGTLSNEGNILASFLIYVRKLSTSYIYVAHQSYIPRSTVEGFEPYYIYKIERNNFIISENFYEIDSDVYDDIDSIIVDMPNFNDYDKHYLDIMSHAFTDFKLNDIDWFELKSRLTQFHVGENLKEEVKLYLNEINNSVDNTEISKYEILDRMTLNDLYIGFCIKRNMIIPPATPLNEIILPGSIAYANRQMKKDNINFE